MLTKIEIVLVATVIVLAAFSGVLYFQVSQIERGSESCIINATYDNSTTALNATVTCTDANGVTCTQTFLIQGSAVTGRNDTFIGSAPRTYS